MEKKTSRDQNGDNVRALFVKEELKVKQLSQTVDTSDTRMVLSDLDSQLGFWQARHRFSGSTHGKKLFARWQDTKSRGHHIDERYKQAQQHALVLLYEYDRHRIQVLHQECSYYMAWWQQEKHLGILGQLSDVVRRYQSELRGLDSRIAQMKTRDEQGSQKKLLDITQNPNLHLDQLMPLKEQVQDALRKLNDQGITESN